MFQKHFVTFFVNFYHKYVATSYQVSQQVLNGNLAFYIQAKHCSISFRSIWRFFFWQNSSWFCAVWYFHVKELPIFENFLGHPVSFIKRKLIKLKLDEQFFLKKIPRWTKFLKTKWYTPTNLQSLPAMMKLTLEKFGFTLFRIGKSWLDKWTALHFSFLLESMDLILAN